MGRCGVGPSIWASALRACARWVVQADIDDGNVGGVTTSDKARITLLEQEVRERGNPEVLRALLYPYSWLLAVYIGSCKNCRGSDGWV